VADRAYRRVGSNEPIRYRIELDTPIDLVPLSKTFWMWATDAASTRLVNGAAVIATDVSLSEGRSLQTVWVLEWTPPAEGYAVAGYHRAEFEIDYGGASGKRQYPRGTNFIDVVIQEHKGVVPTP
jgi:hypothetical protein